MVALSITFSENQNKQTMDEGTGLPIGMCLFASVARWKFNTLGNSLKIGLQSHFRATLLSFIRTVSLAGSQN